MLGDGDDVVKTDHLNKTITLSHSHNDFYLRLHFSVDWIISVLFNVGTILSRQIEPLLYSN